MYFQLQYLIMAFKYKVTDQNELYFITITVISWIDVGFPILLETLKNSHQNVLYLQLTKRAWLLDKFSFAAKTHSKSDEYKFWQDGFHPIILYSNEFNSCGVRTLY